MPVQNQSQPPVYHHFILLVWEECGTDGQHMTWRFSLQDSYKDERIGFKNFEELRKFLKKWLEDAQTVEKKGQND
jgi:hypothetical protein